MNYFGSNYVPDQELNDPIARGLYDDDDEDEFDRSDELYEEKRDYEAFEKEPPDADGSDDSQ